MTTHIRTRPLLFRQIGRLLRRHPQPTEQPKQPRENTEPQTRPSTQLSVCVPSLPPQTFIDYAADGDEPADLALQDLIPAGLAAFNQPHFVPMPALSPQPSETAPACPINACFLSERPFTEKEMNDAELAELIPLELSKLNIPPRKNTKKKVPVTQTPLPDLSKLKKS
ncbi:MAG: hypothetical protein AAFV85_19865 [Cyanobacteria bacterium J06634_6]